MIDTTELRKELLVLANELSDGESLSAYEAGLPMSKLVSRICIDREATLTLVTLFAVILARFIDEQP